jgi:hypothetical protein
VSCTKGSKRGSYRSAPFTEERGYGIGAVMERREETENRKRRDKSETGFIPLGFGVKPVHS